MKVSINELLEQIKELLKEDDSDLAISLLENATDTLTGLEEDGMSEDEVNAKIAEAVEKTEADWKKKYHDRFYGGDDVNEETDTVTETETVTEDREETVEETIEDMLVERK